VAVLGACASRPAPPPHRPPERPPEELALGRQDRAYLVDPFAGYADADAVDAGRRDRLQGAFRALLERGDLAGARDTAAELIAEDAGLLPAQVLAAQVDFAAGRPREVVSRLVPVGDRMPAYLASQLLLGRAAEQAGDVPLAYAAFRAVATRSQLAFQRLGELHPRAMEILANRLQEALRTQNLDEAEKQLALMESWGAAETATLEGARDIAVARGDRRAELTAIKELMARRQGDKALLERQAELELAVGDPGAGLQIVQDLAARDPKNPEMAEKLAAAKFRWRLSLLPQPVQEVAAKAELNKGDLAVLLYWLIPNVRYGRPSGGRIATDVLDHPRREEIVRVVNLGLMDVDATLHRFSPSAPVRWGTALRSLTRVVEAFAGDGADCLGAGKGSQSGVCTAAAGCGLVPSADECQAGVPLSGGDAVELIRRTLKRLGGT
jgi:tetratricopeptide (TPR) repeat protein